MDEIDTWRAANILVKRYKGEAVFVAAKRADALLERGDHEGCSAWVRIGKAVDAHCCAKLRGWAQEARHGEGSSLMVPGSGPVSWPNRMRLAR